MYIVFHVVNLDALGCAAKLQTTKGTCVRLTELTFACPRQPIAHRISHIAVCIPRVLVQIWEIWSSIISSNIAIQVLILIYKYMCKFVLSPAAHRGLFYFCYREASILRKRPNGARPGVLAAGAQSPHGFLVTDTNRRVKTASLDV